MDRLEPVGVEDQAEEIAPRRFDADLPLAAISRTRHEDRTDRARIREGRLERNPQVQARQRDDTAADGVAEYDLQHISKHIVVYGL